MFSTTVTEGTHTAQVTIRLEDCGATFTDVVCSCGYSGTETEGTGCWQQGHNIASEVDATHTPLMQTAYAEYATDTHQVRRDMVARFDATGWPF